MATVVNHTMRHRATPFNISGDPSRIRGMKFIQNNSSLKPTSFHPVLDAATFYRFCLFRVYVRVCASPPDYIRQIESNFRLKSGHIGERR